MMTKGQSEQAQPDKETFTLGKRKLLSLRRKMSTHVVDMAAEVKSLKAVHPDTPEGELLEWLRSEVGLSYEDAKTQAYAHSRLVDRAEAISDLRLSPEVLRILANSDEGSWTECFARLQRGEKLNGEIIRATLARKMAAAELWEAANLTVRQGLVADHRWPTRSLEAKARELLALMDHLTEDFLLLNELPELGDEGWCEEAYDRDNEDYVAAEMLIARKATEIRALLEMFFGTTHVERADVMDLSVTNSLRASIAFSWHALRDLEARKFVAFDLKPGIIDARALYKCVQFLAGQKSRVLPPRAERRKTTLETIPTQQFSMVDIAAGLGGAALGLETAGFKPLALYEYWPSAQRLLKRNRKRWQVHTSPISFNRKASFVDGVEQEITLLTGGTTLRPFSPQNRNGGKKYNYEDFGYALEAVEALKPTAFFFCLDPRVLEERKGHFRKEFELSVRAIGYEVQWHKVDVSIIGVPQNSPVAVLVGMRDGHIDKFHMPVITSPLRTSLTDAIGDLIGSRKWDGTETRHDRRRYKQWSVAWTERCAHELAPPVLTWDNGRVEEHWAKLGIDIAGYTIAPLSPFDTRKPGFKIRLTPEMLKRLQGFPTDWHVADDMWWSGRLLETAVPPALAKYVGLAIYSALAGEAIDVRTALTESFTAAKRHPAEPSYRTIEIVHRFSGIRRTLRVPKDWAPAHHLRGRMYLSPLAHEEREMRMWREYWDATLDGSLQP